MDLLITPPLEHFSIVTRVVLSFVSSALTTATGAGGGRCCWAYLPERVRLQAGAIKRSVLSLLALHPGWRGVLALT